jgi:hypothetical protein
MDNLTLPKKKILYAFGQNASEKEQFLLKPLLVFQNLLLQGKLSVP